MVDEKQIGSGVVRIGMDGAYIDIHPPILVKIIHGYSRTPGGSGHLRNFADVFKPKFPAIQIEAGRDRIACKKHVGQVVIVKITDANASTIVDVLKLKGIE